MLNSQLTGNKYINIAKMQELYANHKIKYRLHFSAFFYITIYYHFIVQVENTLFFSPTNAIVRLRLIKHTFRNEQL